MELLVALVLVLLSGAALALAVRDRNDRRRLALAASGLVAVVGYYLLTRDLAWLAPAGTTAVIAWWFGLVGWTWAVIPFGYLVGVAVRQVRSAVRRVLYESAYGLLACLVLWFGLRAVMQDRSVWSDATVGDIHQTTEYTCGPAAAATLLHRLGVATSERELAELAATDPLHGTHAFPLARAIDRVAGVGRAQVVIDERMPTATPFVAAVRLNAFIGHWVVVEDVSGGLVRGFDPIAGRMVQPVERFRARYLGVAVVVARR